MNPYNLSICFNYLTLRLFIPDVNIEIIMYAVITKAKPVMPQSAVNKIKRSIISSCLSFPLIAILLILSENMGISDIISHENRRISIIVNKKNNSLRGAILCRP